MLSQARFKVGVPAVNSKDLVPTDHLKLTISNLLSIQQMKLVHLKKKKMIEISKIRLGQDYNVI
jgi:hypothetical protein